MKLPRNEKPARKSGTENVSDGLFTSGRLHRKQKLSLIDDTDRFRASISKLIDDRNQRVDGVTEKRSD